MMKKSTTLTYRAPKIRMCSMQASSIFCGSLINGDSDTEGYINGGGPLDGENMFD